MIEHDRTGPVDWLTWAFSRVAMWGPAAIVVVIFYEVVMRYLFFRPTLWANELSLWLGGAIYVTAGLYAMQQRSHIRIFILYDMAPLWLRRVFDVVSLLCVFIFAFAVVWGGFGEAAAKFWRWERFGTAFDPPIPATNKVLILVTLVVLALQAASNLVRDWPSAPAVRKTFDIVATLLVVALCLWALPILFADDPNLKVPFVWRVAIGVLLLASIALATFGLLRDFNRTPTPIVESHDPLDEVDLEAARNVLGVPPDEVLSGRPPPVDAASGRPEGPDDPPPGRSGEGRR